MPKCLLYGLIFLSLGCSTYQSKVNAPRNQLKNGQFAEAITSFKALAEKPSDDQLIYLLDYATALQVAGQFKESNQIYLKADKLADLQNYYSISRLTMATLGGEEMTQYKGDSFEIVLINAMLALNYISLNEPDDAMVEVRRLNEKINKIRLDGRENYEQNPFAHYLMGLLYEMDRKFDDAYIAYDESYKLSDGNQSLGADLLRSAKISKRSDAYNKWKTAFPEIKEDPAWTDKKSGELVILVEQGWGPEKIFMRGDYKFPDLRPVHSVTDHAAVIIDGQQKGFTHTLYDIERVAMHTLKEDQGWLIARRVASRIGKAVVADQVRQKNQALGNILELAMVISDRADLRQWSTLPQTIQMNRTWLKSGKYKVKLNGMTGSDLPSGESMDEREIEIKPGKKTILVWRTLK
jgi:hypothetical protein